ncbi:MAG: phospholipase D family protein [Hyphomicrobiales bacterium]|nr:phospholipase D family protein [Hyphomicrobiales bacterium]
MADFLAETFLSEKIRDLLSGGNIRCAVAFWGEGANKLLLERSGKFSTDARIVCDVSMGSTSPNELEALRAPNNPNLRYLNGLHAKVYISDKGSVVTSANMSSNGIGFGDKEARLVEAGIFYSPNEPGWQKVADWFEQIYERSKQIDQPALDLAKERWSPPKGAGKVPYPVRAGSLLDLVYNEPELFEDIGFVFVRRPVSDEQAENARKEIISKLPDKKNEINNWTKSNMFAGWTEFDVKRWPITFIEFWMPKEKLKVIGREVVYPDSKDGSVLTRRAWSSVMKQISRPLPTTEEIGALDGDIAKKVFDQFEQQEGGRIFRDGKELWKVLDSVMSE